MQVTEAHTQLTAKIIEEIPDDIMEDGNILPDLRAHEVLLELALKCYDKHTVDNSGAM